MNDDKQYIWKDIISIDGKIYTESFPISGIMDTNQHYQLDMFYDAVCEKYNVDQDDVLTYMMDNIEFDTKLVEFGIRTMWLLYKWNT